MSLFNSVIAEEEAHVLNAMAAVCRHAADKWYHNPVTGERLFLNKGERCMLIVTEIAEAFEGERRNLMDDKLPHRPMAEVELADAIIRILDYAAEHQYDVGGAMREKMIYNATREDHTNAARLGPNGKTC